MDEALAKAFETLEELEHAEKSSQELLPTQLAILRFQTFEIYRHLDTELSKQRERQMEVATLAEEERRLKQAIQSDTKQTKDYETQAVLANGQDGLLAQYHITAQPDAGSERTIETVILNEASARRDLFRHNAELSLQASQLRGEREDITKFLYDSRRLNTWFNELIGFARKIQREYQHTYDVLVEGIDEPDPFAPRRFGRNDKNPRRRDETRDAERERRRNLDDERRDTRRADSRVEERSTRGMKLSAEEPRRDVRDQRELRRDERVSERREDHRADDRRITKRREDRRTERRDERRDERVDSRRDPSIAKPGGTVHREDDRQRSLRTRGTRKRRRRD